MPKTLFPIIAAGLAIASTPANARTTLQPSSDWQLREYDDKCRVSRSFGSGKDAVSLWLDKGGPGFGINVTLIGRPFRSPYGPRVDIGFGETPPVTRNFVIGTSSKGRPVLSMFGVVPVSLTETVAAESVDEGAEETVNFKTAAITGGEFDAEAYQKRLAAVESLALSRALIDPVELQFDGFDAAMTDLFACTAKLTTRLRQQEQSALRRSRPVEIAKWAKKIQENYPAHLVRERQEGNVGVRMTINAKGRATFCEVTRYSGPVSFNDTACLQMLRHSRFEPALNADGEPVASFYSTTITYRLN